MVIEEVCRLFAIFEQQHADDAIQGEDGRALCAYSVGHIECPEGILPDLKEAMSMQAQRGTRDSHNHELLLHLSSCASNQPIRNPGLQTLMKEYCENGPKEKDSTGSFTYKKN